MSLETIVYVTPGVPVYLGQVCSVQCTRLTLRYVLVLSVINSQAAYLHLGLRVIVIKTHKVRSISGVLCSLLRRYVYIPPCGHSRDEPRTTFFSTFFRRQRICEHGRDMTDIFESIVFLYIANRKRLFL